MGGKASITRGERPSMGVVVAAFGYAIVTTYLARHLNLWRDEMYSLHSTSGSVRFAFDQALHFELQPPVYFVALGLWRTMDPSAFFARTFSVLCGAGAVLTTGALSRRILPRVNPAVAATVVATHPLVIWAGSEIRVYALAIFLSSLLALTFFAVYWDPREPSRTARWGYIALAVLTLHTQYYLGLLLAAFGATLLARRATSKRGWYALDMLVVLVLTTPLFWAAKQQLDAYRKDVGHPSSFDIPMRLVWSRYEAYLFTLNDVIDRPRANLATLRAARWAYRAFLGGSILALVVAIRRNVRVWPRPPSWPLLVAVAVYAPGMFLLARTAGPLAVGPRHTAGLLVPLLLAVLSIPAAAGPKWSGYAAAFLVASNLPTLAVLHLAPLAKECDCRRVAEALVRYESNREPILVFPSEEVMPMSEYYHGQNRLIAVPRPPDLHDWDQTTFRLVDTKEIERALEGTELGSQTLWVYTGTEPFAATVGRPTLEKFLSAGYAEDSRYEFANGELLRHFHRTSHWPIGDRD